MRFGLILLALAGFWIQAAPLPQIKNCDGKMTVLNPAGQFTVVLASSQPLADTTREFGKALYPWQGLEDFRLIVVVDLRKSLGSFVRTWTTGRMKADLDEEALALQPWFQARGNTNNPRKYLTAIPDFDDLFLLAPRGETGIVGGGETERSRSRQGGDAEGDSGSGLGPSGRCALSARKSVV